MAGKRLGYDITQVLVLLGINVVIGFVVPNIDWRAHLGGMVTGALVAAVLAYAPKVNRALWQWLGVLAVLGLLVVVVMWRTAVLREELLAAVYTWTTGTVSAVLPLLLG